MLSTRNKSRYLLITALVSVMVLALSHLLAVARAAPGGGTAPLAPAASSFLDTSFGVSGKVTTSFLGGNDHKAYGLGLQSNGKIVVAGYANITATDSISVALARYDPSNGSLDTSFNGIGKRLDGNGDFTSSKAFAAAIQTNDKIVVAGITDWVGHDAFMLRRYLAANGAPDTTIDGSGDTITDFAAGTMPSINGSGAEAVAIQPDGKIVVAGYVNNSSELKDFAVARYCPSDGTLDDGANCGADGFDTAGTDGPLDGTVVTQMGSQTNDIAHAVAISNTDGTIVVVGERDGTFVMTRYDSSGSQFGVADDNTVGPGYAVAIQPDGQIIVAGSKTVTDMSSPNCIKSNGHVCDRSVFWVARVNSFDLSLDSSFGVDGVVTTAMNSQGNDDKVYAIAIQSDGKIVVAGVADTGINEPFSTPTNSDPWLIFHHNNDFAVARYNSDGSLDPSFGTGGKVTTDFAGSVDDVARAVAVQSDGKIVVAGYNDAKNFAVARYLAKQYFVYLPLIMR